MGTTGLGLPVGTGGGVAPDRRISSDTYPRCNVTSPATECSPPPSSLSSIPLPSPPSPCAYQFPRFNVHFAGLPA